MKVLNSFHHDLKTVKELVYDQANLRFANLNWNAESREYGACSFELDNKKIQYRVSKITPAKIGQFVTLWKRNQDGITQAFDDSDEIDFVIIMARNGDHWGQFIFPKKILADREIISQNGKSGKRGIRVYPPWDIPKNKQAEKTQRWQINYFLPLKKDGSTDLGWARKLFAPNNEKSLLDR